MQIELAAGQPRHTVATAQLAILTGPANPNYPRGSEKRSLYMSITMEYLRTGTDKIAATVNRLCRSLVIELSKTQKTLYR